jgi:cytochrome c oxidase subunit 4
MAQTVSQREEQRVHAIPARRYYVVWIVLLVLTAITIVAGVIHLPGVWALVLALTIAVVKASLVALFFMHLWDHGGANRLVLVTALFFLGLLLGITLLDNATRFPLTNPPTRANQRWQPPGPDILSPSVAEPGTSSRQQGARDRAPQEPR